MHKTIIALLLFQSVFCQEQKSNTNNEEILLQEILSDPSQEEIDDVLFNLRQKEISAKNITVHDSIVLENNNKLYVLSHIVEGNRHYGVVIFPEKVIDNKLPAVILATGGDGMHTKFDIANDFNHKATQFPNFLGNGLDQKFIVIIPSFRGQELIVNDRHFQSEGVVNDAFDGATTDTIGFLNAVMETYDIVDDKNISICGGSRGGTVALLTSVRDKRISKVSITAAPTDMKSLYLLYPNQFKLLFFSDVLNNKISKEKARIKFISSSPIYFSKHFPEVQIHHDENDPFVPVKFAKQLVNSITKYQKKVDVFYYNEGIHGFWDDTNYWKRVQEFLLKQ